MTSPLRRAALALLAATGLGLVGLAPAGAAGNDAVAWSVSPAGADGKADGRTRLELQLAPGATATDHVTIANSSTTDQTFDVYGADAFNTANGGYDLQPAATRATDVGSWVKVDHQQVAVPALKSATVAVTVAVPAGASPGDHAGGIVVSRAHPAADAQGVVLDTRVAVRLSVRVAGALAPALLVEDVHVGYPTSAVPFGSAAATVTFQVRNTGNVTVLGKPRVRVSGPFGLAAAVAAADETREILPGQSFQVREVVPGVAAALLDTAVVDVAMDAAPGPTTTIPAVSSTSRTTFVAVPWTGLAVLVVLALGVWFALRVRRRRRAEGEAMWAQLVDEAREGILPERGGVTGGGASRALLIGLVLVGSSLGLAGHLPTALAADVVASPVPSLELVVPAAPSTTSAATTTSTTRTTGTTTTTTTIGSDAVATTAPVSSQVLADDSVGASAAPTPTPSATAALLSADTVWRSSAGLTPVQWALIVLSGIAVLVGVVFGVRAVMASRAA